jgi:hypothetical protein
VIPPDANAAFVAGMEDVLEVYQRPHDPEHPVVCLDETSKQLVAETRVPIAAKPGQPARHDYEYKRNGTANLFMIFAPLEGWRHVEVTDRHTAVDYAQILKAISDTNFPKAKKIVLVQDNLNIHRPASLYEAFPAAEARRVKSRPIPTPFSRPISTPHRCWLVPYPPTRDTFCIKKSHQIRAGMRTLWVTWQSAAAALRPIRVR